MLDSDESVSRNALRLPLQTDNPLQGDASRTLRDPQGFIHVAKRPPRIFLLRQARPLHSHTTSRSEKCSFPEIVRREGQRNASFHYVSRRKNRRGKSKAEKLFKKMDCIVDRMNAEDVSDYEDRSFSRHSRRAGEQISRRATPTHVGTVVTRGVKSNPVRDGQDSPLDYSEAALEQLINNDLSPYLDKGITPKQQFTLSSMKATFLRSNFLKHQPLLNVFQHK